MLETKILQRVAHYITVYVSIGLITFVVGTVTGFKIATSYYKHKVNEAVKLGGFIHENRIYDIKERIVTK